MSDNSDPLEFGGFPHTWGLFSRNLGQLIKMDLSNGDIVFGKNYTPSAAAREFWESMGKQLRDVDEARNLGFTEGYSEGYDTGHIDGYEAGCMDSRDEGE